VGFLPCNGNKPASCLRQYKRPICRQPFHVALAALDLASDRLRPNRVVDGFNDEIAFAHGMLLAIRISSIVANLAVQGNRIAFQLRIAARRW